MADAKKAREPELDESEEGDGAQAAESEGEAGKRRFPFNLSFKLSFKKLAIFGGGALLLVGLAGGAYFYFFGSHGGDEVAGEQAPAVDPSDIAFFDLPDLLVNLSQQGDKPAYLKLKVSLEVHEPGSVAQLEELKTRIVDQFQLYLRELRIEDLQGSAGSFRLKEELLRRVNLAVRPVIVADVLFREMIVQ